MQSADNIFVLRVPIVPRQAIPTKAPESPVLAEQRLKVEQAKYGVEKANSLVRRLKALQQSLR